MKRCRRGAGAGRITASGPTGGVGGERVVRAVAGVNLEGVRRILALEVELVRLDNELERSRDALAARVQHMRRLAADRAEHERQAHEQLRLMKLEPGRYKFARLPVRDLGQGGCGVWEVRPRLGLIGMLAGWWQLKLSSGCPLARGSRSTRGPDSPK